MMRPFLFPEIWFGGEDGEARLESATARVQACI